MRAALAASLLLLAAAAAAAPRPSYARLEEAVRLAPRDVEARKGLMRALWDARRFSDARAQALEVLRLSPSDAEAREVAARAVPLERRLEAERLRDEAAGAYRAGRGDEAVALYRKMLAVEVEPDVPGLKDLMWTLWRLDRLEEAVELARAVRAVRPDEKDAASVLAVAPRMLLLRERDRNCAAADALLARADFSGAASLLEPLLAKDPLNARYRRRYTSALRLAGRLEEALGSARRLSELEPRNPEAWSSVGMLLSALGRPTQALEAYARSLALAPHRPMTELGLARALVAAREFERALPLLRRLEGVPETARRARPLLAASLYWRRRFDEALPYWRAAQRDFPDVADLRYYEGMTLMALDRPAESRAIMTALFQGLGYEKAFAFLLDDATARGELPEAAALLEKRLRVVRPQDESLALRLADLLRRLARPESAEHVVDRLLSVLPSSQPAWLFKADLAYDRARYDEAEAAAERARALNPGAREPYELLAAVAEQRGELRDAAALIERSGASMATDPERELEAARALYDAGRRRAARASVRRLLREAESSPALPILLYHGLTTVAEDPLLAHPFHHRLDVFESHVKALRDAGFTPVTVADVAAWYGGKGALPEKPVLITFDDARMDSFLLGDPVLERYGFKATMMAALVNVDDAGHPPGGYASWARLREYQATGRWEVQSHGDLAHNFVQNGPYGSKGLFLINRQWLPERGRLETIDEWRARADADYESSRRKLKDQLGVEPVGYAYPEGAAGQKGDAVNEPNAEPVNRALVAKYYRLAFVQDDTGLNLRTRDPLRLARVQPDQRWDGAALLRHFKDRAPAARAKETLLAWAASEGKTREAYALLASLKEDGVSEPVLLAQEARIRLEDGDPSSAAGLARRAQQAQDTPETAALLRAATSQETVAWSPGYEWTQDSARRMSWSLANLFTSPPVGPLLLHALQRRAELVDRAAGVTVVDNAGGAGAEAALGRWHRLIVDGARETLNGSGAGDVTTATAELDSRWVDALSSKLLAGKSLLASARAAAQGVTSRSLLAQARWTCDDEWALDARAKRSHYSDDNDRTAVEASLERLMGRWDRFDVKAVYRFAYDDARFASPLYFSPAGVRVHSLGPQLGWTLDRRLALSARYLPSWAAERGSADQLTHEAQLALTSKWSASDAFRLGYDFFQTPTYSSHGLSAELAHHF